MFCTLHIALKLSSPPPSAPTTSSLICSMNLDQRRIPFVFMRGGTSKALFFYACDVRAPGPGRDRVLKHVISSHDAMQIDSYRIRSPDSEEKRL